MLPLLVLLVSGAAEAMFQARPSKNGKLPAIMVAPMVA